MEKKAKDASDHHDNYVTPAMKDFKELAEDIQMHKAEIAEMIQVL